MSSRKPNPEEQIAALGEERVRIAGERHTLEAELGAAEAIIKASPDRHREAVIDEARGRGDAVQQVETELAQARATEADRTARIAGLEAAEREIAAEQEAIYDSDEGLEFFTAKAEAASRAAEAARATAEQSRNALEAAWKDALSQWGQIRTAYKRRGQEERAPREVPWPSFQAPVHVGMGHTSPWPGGLRPEDSAEALVQFGRDAV
jgi:DNA repair exonuclease SbcCD ATPase subunit